MDCRSEPENDPALHRNDRRVTAREFSKFKMTPIKRIHVRFFFALGLFFGLNGVAASHSGIVDGYGCHRGPDKVSYHCHQGQFAGRTFKSKEDFLRELRGGKSAQLSPKKNPPQPQRKLED
jgi:hypothetical protein